MQNKIEQLEQLEQQINALSETINNMIEKKTSSLIEELKQHRNQLIEQYSFESNQLNVNNRNSNNITEYTDNILQQKNNKKQKYKKFLESYSVNGVIYAPTQVGKTDAIKQYIEVCMKNRAPVIVSCDNKTDQLEQMYNRIESELSGRGYSLILASDNKCGRKIEDCLRNGTMFVVFCLDNSSQIREVKYAFRALSEYTTEIKKISIIHDEGDVITKDRKIDKDTAESHKLWVELTNYINKITSDIDLKRVFVSATPNNCMAHYEIDTAFVIQLEIPQKYTGWDKINCIETEEYDIKDILIKETEEKKRKGGIILYVKDRKVKNQVDLIKEFGYLKCIVHTYNGNGITSTYTDKMKTELENYITNNNKIKGNKKLKMTIEEGYMNISKGMPIRQFYDICKKSGENVILTIGMDLISRGISYVSTGEDCICATTMIYNPGSTMHNVGINQTVGRLTGMARPELERRLYASKEIIEEYKNFNRNMEQMMKEVKDNDTMTNEITKTIKMVHRLNRTTDRPKVNVKYQFAPPPYEEGSNGDRGDMERMIDLWWNANSSIIGSILHYIYENESVDEKTLKNFIAIKGSDNINGYYGQLNWKGVHQKVFRRYKNITSLPK